MWEPTADDLDDLLAQDREAGDLSPRTPAPPAGPGNVPAMGNVPASGTAAKAGSPQQSRAAPPAGSRKKAAGKSAPEPPPSQVIFGSQIRDQSDIEDYEVPPEYRIDPARLHVDSLVVERLADVQAREVDWLWPGRIPLGRLTLLAGDPGVGKSLVALDIAARVSRGTPWPDSPGVSREPAGVIIFSMEDNLRDTIKPRLIQAGADDRQTFVAEGVYNRPPFVELKYKRRFRISDDIHSLRQLVKESWPVRLMILDPITAYCGSGDGVAASVVHSMLSPLLDLANDFPMAILCTTHLRAGGGGKAVYQAAGNLSFTTAARAVWGLVRDPSDPAMRLMVPVKMNLAADVEGLALRLDEKARVVWQPDPVAISADRALETDREGTKIGEAMIWLREVLAAGPRLAREIHEEAQGCGLTKSTVHRAARRLGVTIDRKGYSQAHCSKWLLNLSPALETAPPPPLKSVESREICGTIPEGFSQISTPPEVKSVDDDMKSVERHEICDG